MPKEILQRIDRDRGDISRSRFLLRMIEKIYSVEISQEKQKQTKIKKQQIESRRQPGSQSTVPTPVRQLLNSCKGASGIV